VDAVSPVCILEYAKKVCRLIHLNGADDEPALSILCTATFTDSVSVLGIN